MGGVYLVAPGVTAIVVVTIVAAAANATIVPVPAHIAATAGAVAVIIPTVATSIGIVCIPILVARV